MQAHIERFDRAGGYALPVYRKRRAPEIGAAEPRRVPVVVAGGGLAGLAFAVDLASRGHRCIVLDDDDTVGVRGASSRGIAYARKTLEILSRVGAAQPVLDKGVTWTVGRTFDRDNELIRFDLADDGISSVPPFVNIQQFYIEAALVDRAMALGVDLRWRNEVLSVDARDDAVDIRVRSADGDYLLRADWLVDATGAGSTLRAQLGIGVAIEPGADRWCICDVRVEAPWPRERRTWVRSPWNEGRAVWQHPLPDDVWRLDFQLGDDTGNADVAQAEALAAAHIGAGNRFEVVWAGPWAYRNQLAERFRSGRVFLVGDAAHAFSPFGGRGGNSGVQDAENLAWKLALVLSGTAPVTLLDSYELERRAAAQHNIDVTSATNRFLRPPTADARAARDALLARAAESPQARAQIDTGKMSVPFTYPPNAWLREGGHAAPDMRLGDEAGAPRLIADLTAGPIAGLVIDFCEDAARAAALRSSLAARFPSLRYHRAVDAPAPGGVGTDATVDGASAAVAALAATSRLRSALGVDDAQVAVLLRPDGHVCAIERAASRDAVVAAAAAMLG